MRVWPLVGLCCALVGAGFFARAQSCAPIQLTTPAGSPNDNFGAASAATSDTVVFGAPGRTVSGRTFQGQAFVFRFNGSAWALEGTLTASDGAQGDSFGNSVAISGNTILVGAYSKTSGTNTFQGAAYVFTRSGSTWSQQAKLLASDAAAGDLFGYSVSVSADSAAIGAYGKTNGANPFQGAAYIFTRSGTTWTQQAKLLASDGATNDFFGVGISIAADTTVIGADGKTIGANAAQGAAYVFTRIGAAWTQQARLTASDASGTDYFGSAVSVDSSTIVVGSAYKAVGANTFQGAVYAFTRTGLIWTQQAKMFASDGTSLDYFGGAVSLSGDSVVIGADNQTVSGNSAQGAAYIFQRSGVVWSQQAKLVSATSAAGDAFGQSVAVAGSTVVAGAPNQTVSAVPNRGASYIFGSNIPINLIQQPASTAVCSQALTPLNVSALGTGPFTYLWQWRSNPSFPTWTTIADGKNSGGTRTFTALNATTSNMTIRLYKQTDVATPFGDFRVIVSNSCGNATSTPATIRLCLGDLNCDGFVDDSDFVLFSGAYNVLECSDLAMPPTCPADLNADNVVDDVDFAIFATAYDALVCP